MADELQRTPLLSAQALGNGGRYANLRREWHMDQRDQRQASCVRLNQLRHRPKRESVD
jgi:hypothetical protein